MDEFDGGDPFEQLVPRPVKATRTDGSYRITEQTAVVASDSSARQVATYALEEFGAAMEFDLSLSNSASTDVIEFELRERGVETGEEGYELIVSPDGITLRAPSAAGLFFGVQTLRQLLPPKIESDSPEPGPWPIPCGRISDTPRFEYRGVHLDVARHFFTIDAVKRYVDHLSRYKFNYLHLHLTDDQGWRIEIEGWPRLTGIGANTEVGGGEGGYYTQAEYEDLVEYARQRFITVVPEIDVPGHTNAALASYAELNPDGKTADPYTGTEVGFSTLRVDSETTDDFLQDVFHQLAGMTPGPYLHFGGDEVEELTDAEYTSFVARVANLIETEGKRPIGWHEILAADLPDSTVIQYWADEPSVADLDVSGAAEAGHQFIISPGCHAYLDMKYDADTELGLDWAGHVSVADAYEWDPGHYVDGVDEASVLGIEAALWTEQLETISQLEYMLFPRVAAIAEKGWTPQTRTGWDGFRTRLAAHEPRWERRGINYYRAPEVPWATAPS